MITTNLYESILYFTNKSLILCRVAQNFDNTNQILVMYKISIIAYNKNNYSEKTKKLYFFGIVYYNILEEK